VCSRVAILLVSYITPIPFTIDLYYDSPLEVVKKIQAAIIKYGETNVSFEVNYEYDYGDSIKLQCYLSCVREMTKEEKKKQQEKEKSIEEQRLQLQRKQYEELKKKFGE